MNWAEFERVAPRLAALGRERLDRDRLALIGTLRADGSPPISPIEPNVVMGELLLAMEWPTAKARDVLRDPRCTVHSVVSDPDGGDGEFKLLRRAMLTEDPVIVEGPDEAWWRARRPATFRVFRLEIDAAAFVEWDPEFEKLRVVRWSPEDGMIESVRDRLT